jgi:hypothetical protein
MPWARSRAGPRWQSRRRARGFDAAKDQVIGRENRDAGSASVWKSTDSPGRAESALPTRGFCGLPKPEPLNIVARSNGHGVMTT